MDCYRKVLGSKIHRATVTQADLHYEGSITIPPELLSASGISEYEAVWVWNIAQGTRFETYAIAGDADSGDICVNGAAAHLASPGDLVIIACFINIDSEQVSDHKPKLVFVGPDNRQKMHGIDKELPGPKTRPASKED